MIHISIAPYLNSRPFVYGIEQCGLLGKYTIEPDIPSVCAEKMLRGEADVGLMPVAAIGQLPWSKILTGYCIGAETRIRSVMLFCEVPMKDICRIWLDYHSQTSVKLLRILTDRFWKITPEWLPAKEGYEKEIHGNTAGLVIGDRALFLRDSFPWSWDLAKAWRNYTSLPFVFACWVANKSLPPSFIKKFEKAIRWGVEHRRQVIPAEGIPLYTAEPPDTHQILPANLCRDYLMGCVSYSLNNKKLKGMELFLDYCFSF